MPSFLYMKILESSPERYDRGLEILSRGRIGKVYERISAEVSGKGKEILDMGCGTGNLSMACAEIGAKVTGIDINSGMLEIAGKKVAGSGLEERLSYREMGVAEMRSAFGAGTFDGCVSCLAFSEMTAGEQSYAIESAYYLLRPGGMLVIADEVLPSSLARRIINSLLNFPMKLIAYILTQSTTRPLGDIVPDFKRAGFEKIESERLWNDTFLIVKGRKGERN